MNESLTGIKNKKLSVILRFLLLFTCLILAASSGDEKIPVFNENPALVHKPKPIESLTLEEIWSYYIKNPCYLPLLKDSSLWQPGKRIGFDYIDLFNDSLPKDHKYRNRYLVGDFNVLEPNGQNRIIKEIYPSLKSLKEFFGIPDDLVNRMETAIYGSGDYNSLIEDMKTEMGDSALIYINFLEKVWQYKMIPINRKYSIEGNYLYSGGQSVVMCEACKDTLIMLGKFAASAKGRGLGIKHDNAGNEVKYYYEMLPIVDFRYYYAGMNLITSKNWDYQRKYEELDLKRDIEMGGGNHMVTLYQDKDELPNFMMFKPSKEYPDAMIQNGIHEVSLRIMARGMLGTPNSIGCIRVSDFGAKFLRWWTPEYCKFFIAYDDKRYNKKIDMADSIFNYLPFKNQAEGDTFRKWVIKNKPFEAKVLEIDKTGDFRNGYILDAYYYLKDNYKNYINNLSGNIATEHVAMYKNSPLNRIVLMQRY
jgi:hypothetical protein